MLTVMIALQRPQVISSRASEEHGALEIDPSLKIAQENLNNYQNKR